MAEHLATEVWNYRFNADISQVSADIGVDEESFDLWHDGSTKVTVTYHDAENTDPGITALKDADPDSNLQFEGNLYSMIPEDARQKYEEAVQLKKEALKG